MIENGARTPAGTEATFEPRAFEEQNIKGSWRLRYQLDAKAATRSQKALAGLRPRPNAAGISSGRSVETSRGDAAAGTFPWRVGSRRRRGSEPDRPLGQGRTRLSTPPAAAGTRIFRGSESTPL